MNQNQIALKEMKIDERKANALDTLYPGEFDFLSLSKKIRSIEKMMTRQEIDEALIPFIVPDFYAIYSEDFDAARAELDAMIAKWN